MLKIRLANNPKLAACVAELHGVSVEHLLDTIRKRNEYKAARRQRIKSRKKTLAKQKGARAFTPFKRKPAPSEGLYAGEGELHALIRLAGLTQQQFCDAVGINVSTFTKYHGHPLHPWPIRFMRLFVWQMNARTFLEKKGYDPEQFNAALPELHNHGRYPRKPGDVELPK